MMTQTPFHSLVARGVVTSNLRGARAHTFHGIVSLVFVSVEDEDMFHPLASYWEVGVCELPASVFGPCMFWVLCPTHWPA